MGCTMGYSGRRLWARVWAALTLRKPKRVLSFQGMPEKRTCPNCKAEKPAEEFGERELPDGKKIPQAFCLGCRKTTTL